MTDTDHCQKVITEPRVIAGYLRHALFHKSVFVIKHEHIVLNGRLIDITELSARDRSSERSLVFELQEDQDPSRILNGIEENQQFEFAVPGDRTLVKFSARLHGFTSGTLGFSIPSEATVISARQLYRFRAEHLSPSSCTVIVRGKEGHTCVATLEVSDVSTDGIGGLLTLPDGVPFYNEARIQGKLLQQSGAMEIDGQISWAKECASGKEQVFRVGIKNWLESNITPADEITGKERRARPRLRAELLIETISPLFPHSPAILQLEDLSLQGLRARFLNLAERTLFRPNLEITMTSPKLRLKVLHLGEKHVTFKILRSAIEEHIRLFNLQSFLTEADLASCTPVAADFTEIYATSGALSTALARSLSTKSEHLIGANMARTDAVPWFLRWLQQTEDGRLRASILTAPYSDHVWYLGGLAGHIDNDLKMNNDFVGRYFRGLHDFLDSLGSREYLFFNWFRTNSWWTEWDAYLDSFPEKLDSFRFNGDIAYIKDRSKLPSYADSENHWEAIQQGDIERAEAQLEEIEQPAQRRLFSALGLNPFTFGAPGVSELLRRAGHHFTRSFYRIKINDVSALAMLSTFPDYTFINGIVNYPLVYTSRPMNEQELDLLAAKLSFLASKMGIDTPAYFLTSATENLKISETVAQVFRPVRWTFGPPEILKYWAKK